MNDAADGLKALEHVVETIGHQLSDLYNSRNIPQLERVHLASLEWVIAKLADDLHDANSEVRNLRLEVASARREASEKQQKQVERRLSLEKQLAQVTAERDAAYARLAKIDCAAVSSDTAAHFTKNAGGLPVETGLPEWHGWNRDTQLYHPRHPDVTRCLPDATPEDYERHYGNGWRSKPAEPVMQHLAKQIHDEGQR
jgi:TolA-binding protein